MEPLYMLYTTTPSTHIQFKARNLAWYLARLIERDSTINRHNKPKEIREQVRLYY
jgi:hypothetical protein